MNKKIIEKIKEHKSTEQSQPKTKNLRLWYQFVEKGVALIPICWE